MVALGPGGGVDGAERGVGACGGAWVVGGVIDGAEAETAAEAVSTTTLKAVSRAEAATADIEDAKEEVPAVGSAAADPGVSGAEEGSCGGWGPDVVVNEGELKGPGGRAAADVGGDGAVRELDWGEGRCGSAPADGVEGGAGVVVLSGSADVGDLALVGSGVEVPGGALEGAVGGSGARPHEEAVTLTEKPGFGACG